MRVLGDVKNLTRDLSDSTEEIERINIRKMETSSAMEGKILDLMEFQSKLNIRESKMGKVCPE